MAKRMFLCNPDTDEPTSLIDWLDSAAGYYASGLVLVVCEDRDQFIRNVREMCRAVQERWLRHRDCQKVHDPHCRTRDIINLELALFGHPITNDGPYWR